MPETTAPSDGVIIKTDDLWKTYDMGEAISVQALCGVSFEIERGEYVAIMGPTDMEILKGVKPGDEIVTGSFSVLRTLKTNAKVKVDNSGAKTPGSQT